MSPERRSGIEDVCARVDRLIATRQLGWVRTGSVIAVPLGLGRTQRVSMRVSGDRCVFVSRVVSAAFVTRKARVWRDLAYRVWRKNAVKEIVCFAFDEEDALVGVVEQPVGTLDDEELELYVGVLARECDRFEYALTGGDVE